jgi:hypothetical protein
LRDEAAAAPDGRGVGPLSRRLVDQRVSVMAGTAVNATAEELL